MRSLSHGLRSCAELCVAGCENHCGVCEIQMPPPAHAAEIDDDAGAQRAAGPVLVRFDQSSAVSPGTGVSVAVLNGVACITEAASIRRTMSNSCSRW
jgi:hypothetical protein